MKKFIIFISIFLIICTAVYIYIIVFNTYEADKKDTFFIISKEDFYKEVINNSLIFESIMLCSKKFDIAPELIISIIMRESRFDINAKNINQDGSMDMGLMQLNSFTFKDLSTDMYYDIEVNIFNGTKFLDEMFLKLNNNKIKALCAYNCGWFKVVNEKIPTKTISYVNDILLYEIFLKAQYYEYVERTLIERRSKKYENEKAVSK